MVMQMNGYLVDHNLVKVLTMEYEDLTEKILSQCHRVSENVDLTVVAIRTRTSDVFHGHDYQIYRNVAW